ncbi:MAG: hydantoinase/oxoprolinase family protein [Candidatus Hydrothermarchaeota archaeon]
MKILTLDIGGANTKRLVLDSTLGVLESRIAYFPLWKEKAKLKSFLEGLAVPADHVGITMTGELCDAFGSKREGVEYITSVCEEVFEDPLYLTIDGKLARLEELSELVVLAAANWVASVRYLEREFREGILLDMGSTTTDIIPFRKDEVLHKRTDLERLQEGQLVYTGLLRTPVGSLVDRVPLRGRSTRVAAEHFAITADVYRALGIIGEEDYTCETPDGRGKDKRAALTRVARLLCADLGEVSEGEVLEICAYINDRQVQAIADALGEVAGVHRLGRAFLCGTGRRIAAKACTKAGIEPFDLSTRTEAYANLPCLGLAWMVLEHVRG